MFVSARHTLIRGVVLVGALLGMSTVLTAHAATVLFNEMFDNLDPGRWSITDSQSRLSAAGRLVGLGRSSPAWNDPALVSKTTYPRQAGRALVANVLDRDVGRFGPVVGWTSGALPGDPRFATHALLAQQRVLTVARGSNGPIRLGNVNNGDFSEALTNTEYLYTVVLRPEGAFYFASNGPSNTHAAWPNASLVWVDNSQTATNLAPFISNYDQEMTVDDLRVVDFGGAFATPYGIAAAADTFDRANGPLAGSSPTTGSAPWTVDTGAWAIISNKLGLSSNGSGAGVARLPATADGIFEVTVTTPPSGPYTAGVVFRASDANNYLVFRLVSDRLQLVQVQNGSESVLTQTGFASGPNSPYRLMVRAVGMKLFFYVNDVPVFGGTSSNVAFNATATQAGVYRQLAAGIDNGSLLDQFAAWPGTVALPSEAGPGPYGGAVGSTVLDSQNWNSVNTPGPEWKSFTREWTGRGGALSIFDDPHNMLIKDLARTRYQVSTDVILPSTDGIILSGLAFRAQDQQNMFETRIFKVPPDQTMEIEIGQLIGGSGVVVNYIPITGQTGLGKTVRLSAVNNGQWITVYMNGAAKMTIYNPSLVDRTMAGLYADIADHGSRWDNWEVRSVP